MLSKGYVINTVNGIFEELSEEVKNATNATEPQIEAGDLADVTCATTVIGEDIGVPRTLINLPLSDQLDDDPDDDVVTLFCMFPLGDEQLGR